MTQPTSIDEVVEEIMQSEPMQRVLGIEKTAIVTGRANQYHGVTIPEVLTTALTTLVEQARQEGREEAVQYIKDNSGDAENEYTAAHSIEVFDETLEAARTISREQK